MGKEKNRAVNVFSKQKGEKFPESFPLAYFFLILFFNFLSGTLLFKKVLMASMS